MLPELKDLAPAVSMVGAGGLGSFTVSALLGMPVLAQIGSSQAPAWETVGMGGVIGILLWLLQESHKQRLAEAKEFAEALKACVEAYASKEADLRSEEHALTERYFSLLDRMAERYWAKNGGGNS